MIQEPCIAEDFDFSAHKLNLTDSEFSIMDGVEVISLPGHAPEVLGLIVHLKNRVLIFPQDSIYTPDNFEPTGKASGIVYDGQAYFDSIEKVRILKKAPQWYD